MYELYLFSKFVMLKYWEQRSFMAFCCFVLGVVLVHVASPLVWYCDCWSMVGRLWLCFVGVVALCYKHGSHYSHQQVFIYKELVWFFCQQGNDHRYLIFISVVMTKVFNGASNSRIYSSLMQGIIDIYNISYIELEMISYL